ncbi:MAG TPA: hypothetical protein DDZ88_03195 [Verrucomicrobiales bacterium]|nr:hypothetical protein [Verrucomicrobiales bacterium]
MPAFSHQAASLTEEAATKDYQKWLDDEASAECNERQEYPHPPANPPIEPPDNDTLCFGAYWLRTS